MGCDHSQRATTMDTDRTQDAWRSLDTLLTVGTLGTLTDGQLLDCFRDRRDRAGQEAFRILVDRHGPMVLRLCQSLLRDPHEAEDAFQATFLVLVRKAESIRRRETIGPWLHGVASRVARRARFRSNRRHQLEVPVVVEIAAADSSVSEGRGLEQSLHEEIARLPESFRAPIVLCCLQGLSYDLAARRLGVSEPTLRGRLHRARKRLAACLQRRGIGAPLVARAIESAYIPPPALPSSMVESTVHFALRWSSITRLLVGADVIPESVTALAQGVIHAMFVQTIKMTGLAALLTVGVVGTVVLAKQGKTSRAETSAKRAQVAASSPQNQSAAASREARRSTTLEIEAKTRQILEQLDLPIPMPFANETPLNDVLKYIKQATTTPTFPGIPIYVEPLGLEAAGKSIEFDHPDRLARRATQDEPAKGPQSARPGLSREGWLLADRFEGVDHRDTRRGPRPEARQGPGILTAAGAGEIAALASEMCVGSRWNRESALHSLEIGVRSCGAAIHAQRVIAYLNRGIAQALGRLDSHIGRPRRRRGVIPQIPRWPGGPPTAKHLDAAPGSRRGRPFPRMETMKTMKRQLVAGMLGLAMAGCAQSRSQMPKGAAGPTSPVGMTPVPPFTRALIGAPVDRR